MFRKIVFALIAFFAFGALLWAGQPKQPKLARTYQDWINGPISCLITKTERETFLNLKSDEERDRFIERFWELRNPTPGTPNNEFREEFQRRLAYVNSFYGYDAGTDGWRTDRGRAYLLFGKPQSVTSFLYNQELYPTELWFYANPGLSELPPFFYILFYDKDGIGGYRFYQPVVDGPDKLMRAGPTRQQAYTYLRGINSELARTTLSLIPGEPVDTDTYAGSMGSQMIINAVRGYNQMPSYVSLMVQRALRLERVTSRVHFDLGRASLLTFVAWQGGEPWLNWQLEIQDPKQPKAASGQVKFEVHSRLFVDSHLVFERTDSPSFNAPATAEEELKKRPFTYEDRVAVAPGKYRLMVTARNVAANQSYEASREFEVAGPTDRAMLSDLLIVSRFEPDRRERPFQFGGVKFFPDPAAGVIPLHPVRVCYQIAVAEPRPAELDVEYVVANTATRARKTFQEKLDLRGADAFGSLITVKTLATDELTPGNYQLAVRVKDPRNGRIAARSVAFAIAENAGDSQPIVVSQSQVETPQRLAANHYERALCWLAQGRPQEAAASLEASWKLNQNPAVQGLLEHLQARSGRQSR